MTTALARTGELDRYIAEASAYPLLSREQEQALAIRFRDQGDVAAAHELVVSNLRFVVKIAHTYRGYGLKILDLIQEGNIGLMHAVKKFDPDRGYRLISYAVWWIRANIQAYILKSWSMVKMGSGRVRRKLFFKLRSERSRLEMEAGAEGEASKRDLAKHLGVTDAELSEMEMRMAARDFSLNAPLGEDPGATHLDMLTGDVLDQEAQYVAAQERQVLDDVLERGAESLNEKEQYILKARLLNDEPDTLAVIGKHLGISRERVRQLEARIIKKLRSVASEMNLLPVPA